MDNLSREKRSWNMSKIRSKNTRPEKVVRSLLHGMGYRFRLHVRSLPGTPDLVLPRFKTVIFVHGCFWHRHPGCKYAYTPKSRMEFWTKKFEHNIKTHERVTRELLDLGWRVAVIWQCELSDLVALEQRISSLFQSPRE
jgi:DNA mismatch endonuclease (patch repair protein)